MLCDTHERRKTPDNLKEEIIFLGSAQKFLGEKNFFLLL